MKTMRSLFFFAMLMGGPLYNGALASTPLPAPPAPPPQITDKTTGLDDLALSSVGNALGNLLLGSEKKGGQPFSGHSPYAIRNADGSVTIVNQAGKRVTIPRNLVQQILSGL